MGIRYQFYSRGIHEDTLWRNVHPRNPRKFRGFDMDLM